MIGACRWHFAAGVVCALRHGVRMLARFAGGWFVGGLICTSRSRRPWRRACVIGVFRPVVLVSPTGGCVPVRVPWCVVWVTSWPKQSLEALGVPAASALARAGRRMIVPPSAACWQGPDQTRQGQERGKGNKSQVQVQEPASLQLYNTERGRLRTTTFTPLVLKLHPLQPRTPPSTPSLLISP